MKLKDKASDTIKCFVDCALFCFEDYKLKVLLFSDDENEWSLLKNEINYKWTLDENINELILENIRINKVFNEQIKTKTGFDSKLNETSITTSYYALVTSEDCDLKLIQNNGGHWFPIQELPRIHKSSHDLIQLALSNLKIQTMISPLVFELLPEKFTLKQVQEIYEQIFMKELDKRNFIKKISSFDFIVKLNEKDKTTSTKGSYLHKTDRSRVDSLNSFYLNLI